MSVVVIHVILCYASDDLGVTGLERRNITLSIPTETLRRVKMLAAKRNTSVSGFITDLLESLPEDDEYEGAMNAHIALMKRGLGFETGGKVQWTREHLHER